MTTRNSPAGPNSLSESSPVTVHVYDMSWLNEYIGNIGLGVYHTGVEVYNREYCYGGHQFGGSGIFEMTPRDTENLGPNYVYKTSIVVGFTDFTYRDVCMILTTMEQDFRGSHYHLLRKNCNHFSSAFVEILCGASLPKWINRLAVVSAKLPFIEKSIPKEWLTPLQQDAEEPARETTTARSRVSSNVTRSSRRSLRRSHTSLSPAASVSPSPMRTTSATAAATSPGETWRRFQTQVSNYFGRSNNPAAASTSQQNGGGGGGSSSTSVSTPPPPAPATASGRRRRPS